MRTAIGRCKQVARSDAPVMLYGETGTGKELFAQSIHNESPPANGPFLAVNCAAIPATLLESMLFGTEKGAYTGEEKREGLFEKADTGTLLLDEINSKDIALQSKLLRVLQEGTFRRVGGSKLIYVDVRDGGARRRGLRNAHPGKRDAGSRRALFAGGAAQTRREYFANRQSIGNYPTEFAAPDEKVWGCMPGSRRKSNPRLCRGRKYSVPEIFAQRIFAMRKDFWHFSFDRTAAEQSDGKNKKILTITAAGKRIFRNNIDAITFAENS